MLLILKELGRFKNIVSPALCYSENLRELILGTKYKETYQTDAAVFKAMKSHLFSHLFVDDTITATESYIYYDVVMPYINSSIKTCSLIVYVFCHRDILNTFTKKNYEGNRVDIMCQMVEEILLDPGIVREYGIGKLSLSSLKLYNNQKTFYGKVMEFNVPDFR